MNVAIHLKKDEKRFRGPIGNLFNVFLDSIDRKYIS